MVADYCSVEHTLVHCSKFFRQRQKYHPEGKSLAEILGDEGDVDALVGYLHETGLFKAI